MKAKPYKHLQLCHIRGHCIKGCIYIYIYTHRERDRERVVSWPISDSNFYMPVLLWNCFILSFVMKWFIWKLERILLYEKHWTREWFNVFSSKTVLVYKPGVLVIVSLTSLTPLPTSKKTNYHFYEHTELCIECWYIILDWGNCVFSNTPTIYSRSKIYITYPSSYNSTHSSERGEKNEMEISRESICIVASLLIAEIITALISKKMISFISATVL